MQLYDTWRECYHNEIKIWRHFHNFWMHKSKVIPTIVIRYEDLLTKEQVAYVSVLVNQLMIRDIIVY
jgi:hypothetical protein